MELRFTKTERRGHLPKQARPGDAGLDLDATEDHELQPGERKMIGTGVAVEIPEGHAGLVLPRSGLATRYGLTLINSPGLIDPGYRGEILVAVVNQDPSQAVKIKRGDRVAQLVVVGLPGIEPVLVEALSDTERGDGGFGSTGS
ncbi:MAG: dUTP diphosphatase [Actinomycetota bacterium]